MKRFPRKLDRFFWSWGFLKFVLWTITLVALFYAEEDWRGARAWDATKAKWEARGETFDYRKFFTPPIPDAQNIGALPLFQLTRVEGQGGSSYFEDVTLQKTMEKGWSTTDAPQVNGWIWGELSDLGKIREGVATQYAKTFKQGPPSNDPLAQLAALYPCLSELRDEAARRPYCRFAYDDTQALPAGRALGLVTGQIGLSRLLTLEGILALNEHQSDVAVADFRTASKLCAGSGDDPSLVGALVSLGVSAISLGIVYDGLARHAWSDGQLVEVDRVLRAMDFLATYRFAMRSEAAVTVGNFSYFKNRPSDLYIGVAMTLPLPASSNPVNDMLRRVYSAFDEHWRSGYVLWPAGWLDESTAQMVDETLDAMASSDDQKQLVYPEVNNSRQTASTRRCSAGFVLTPWRFLASTLDGFIWSEPAKFAYAQTRVNEARIACALERYWLVHNAYPTTLDALVPDDIAALPHDVMTGKSYLYRLRSDGTFLLYSVGWNQTDNGGNALFVHESSNTSGHPSPDIEHGDWVWPMPK